MYLPEINTVVLEIPKCGSRTLWYSLKRMYTTSDEGHKLSEDIVRPNSRVVGIIRDPVDRFVSSVNYRYKDSRKEIDVAADIDYMLRERPYKVFWPQHWFTENCPEDCELDLYPFHMLYEALQSLGYNDEFIHKNKGDYRISREKILKEKRIDDIWDYYKKDFELWHSVKDRVL